MSDFVFSFGQGLLAAPWWAAIAWPVIWALMKVTVVLMIVMGAVTYATLWERKLLGWVQIRLGPNRVGPWGLLQPIADALKLMTKEIVRPAKSDKFLFYLGPVLTVAPALTAWAVIPFGPEIAVANLNAGLLFFMAIASMEVYGVIISGWASNSKYPFYSALRAAAQMVSYEVSIGFVLISVVLWADSFNLSTIVLAQQAHVFGFLNGFGFNPLLFPMAVVFLISALAETARAPFDLTEAESELVAGYQTEYSSMSFALFWLGEYANVLLMCALNAILFWGGWLPPVDWAPLYAVPGIIWFFAKILIFFFVFSWIKATVPRYRYDQLMRLGWKVFVPICLIWLFVVGVWMMSPLNIWK